MEINDEKSSQSDVVIIGAGPAGLSLASHLQKMNVDCMVLEQGSAPGYSWSKMPEHLYLITLWQSNYLIEGDKELHHPYKKLSASEFSEYLISFAQKNSLRTILNCKVDHIEPEKNGYRIHTAHRDYYAKIVVDCRGYYSYPFIPSYDVIGSPPLMLHFKDYKNHHQLKGYKNILIVGKRLSAGQLIEDLSRENGHNLFLSTRSPLRYGAQKIILNHFLRHLQFYEKVKSLFGGNLKRELEIPMDHSVKKIIDERVKIVPDISRIENGSVIFIDGTRETVDAIIFATGFAPPKAALKDDFESRDNPNYFYLGLNSQRTFTSRFLRGIREDAKILAQLIRGNLESSRRFQ